MLGWPQLCGLQIQDPHRLPWDVSLNSCCLSTLRRANVDLFFFSLTLPGSLPITQNKIWPSLALSLALQPAFNHARLDYLWQMSNQGSCHPERFCPRTHQRPRQAQGARTHFIIALSQTLGGGICQKKIAQLRSPTKEKRRLYYY